MPFGPADVVDALVEVLNGELRSLGIRPELQAVATQIQQDDVGEGIQSGELEVPVRHRVGIAIEANPELVDHRGAEGVVFAEGKEVKAEGLDWYRRLTEVCSLVDLVQLVVDVTAAQLIAGRDVVIDALDEVLEILESGSR